MSFARSRATAIGTRCASWFCAFDAGASAGAAMTSSESLTGSSAALAIRIPPAHAAAAVQMMTRTLKTDMDGMLFLP